MRTSRLSPVGAIAPANNVLNSDGTVIMDGDAFNINPKTLAAWRIALARVRSGNGRARLAMVGDSTTAGFGAATGTRGLTNAKVKNLPSILAAIMAGQGLPTNVESTFGTANLSNYSIAVNTYDPRVVVPGDWLTSSSPNTDSVGGLMYRAGSTVTTTMTFTPVSNVDTFVVHCVANPGNGAIAVNLDGGATLQTIDQNVATPGIISTTFTTALGQHTLGIKRVSGASVFVIGIEAYDSTAKKVDVFTMGGGGWTSADWSYSGNPWGPKPALSYFNPDLTVLNLGINDWTANTISQAGFRANMQGMITAATAGGGSAVLVVPFPSDPARATLSLQAMYAASLYSLAAANNIGLIDLSKRAVNWATANANGYAYDDRHPSALGYADGASAIARHITNV